MLMKQAEELEAAVRAAGVAVRTPDSDIAPAVDVVKKLSALLDDLDDNDRADANPTLLGNLERGARAAALAALDGDRRGLRLGLEQMRVSLRDLCDQRYAAPTHDLRDTAQWIDQILADLTDSQKGALLGVTARTWHRWTATPGTDPGPDAAGRLRILAAVLAHLRFVYAAAGIDVWLHRPHPQLGDVAPVDVLADPLRAPDVVKVAAGERSQVAA